MKQFEIVTNPIEPEQYRTFTLNEHQELLLYLQVMFANGLKG